MYGTVVSSKPIAPALSEMIHCPQYESQRHGSNMSQQQEADQGFDL